MHFTPGSFERVFLLICNVLRVGIITAIREGTEDNNNKTRTYDQRDNETRHPQLDGADGLGRR